jgi:hypothetical protein
VTGKSFPDAFRQGDDACCAGEDMPKRAGNVSRPIAGVLNQSLSDHPQPGPECWSTHNHNFQTTGRGKASR